MKKTLVSFAALFFGALLTFSLSSYLFLNKYKQLRHMNVIQYRKNQTLSSSSFVVQSWMTFDYINKTLFLPPLYLKTALAITDTKYPQVTVRKVADEAGANRLAFMLQVQNLLQAYTVNAPQNNATIH